MAERREDLVALDLAALVTLANRGLVNRAKKVVDRGDGPALHVDDDGTVIATSGDVVTRLVPGRGLADGLCTCASSGVCRHRIAAVLEYQRSLGDDERESPPRVWSPSTFSDAALEAAVGSRTVARAGVVRNKGVVAEVRRVAVGQAVPAVRLSTATVQFLVPDDLAYARCDCTVGRGCEHVVLAVWAFVAAQASMSESVVVVELGRSGDADLEALRPALHLTTAVVLEGVTDASEAMVSRFAAATRPLEEAGFQWPREAVQALDVSLSEYRQRSAAYQPSIPATIVCELHARARASASRGAHPAAAVLGQDVAPETRMDHLGLTALGVRVTGAKQMRRADVFVAVPADRMVLVFRREFALDPDASAVDSLATRSALPGIPLGTLARGQIVTAAARRRANRELIFGRSVVAKTSVTPQRGEWDSLPEPIVVRDFAKLAEDLRTRVPPMIGPRYLADRMHVLAVHNATDYVYRVAEQRIEFGVTDAQDNVVRVRLEHRAVAPGAVDALASACTKGIRFISGEVSIQRGELVLEPISVVTDRVIALDLEEPRGDSLVTARGAPPPTPDPLGQALQGALDLVDQGLHTGLLRAPRPWLEAVRAAAGRLAEVGLSRTSASVRRLFDAVTQLQVGGTSEARSLAVRRWVDASIRLRIGTGLA